MEEIIRNQLMSIEKNYDVKILYAIESGSRAWGFPSKNSDYDVRFIYIHQPDWYLSIDPQGIGKKRDVIELPISELLDISGWEITKALRLFRKRNPSILEWMKSDIIYYQASSFIDQMRMLEPNVYSNSTLYHYLNMAKNNYREIWKESEVNSKQYFNVLRPVLACKWIEEKQSVPPLHFIELMDDTQLEHDIKRVVELLIEQKITEENVVIDVRLLNDFLESEIKRLEAFVKTISVQNENPTKKLDKLFRNTLKELWN